MPHYAAHVAGDGPLGKKPPPTAANGRRWGVVRYGVVLWTGATSTLEPFWLLAMMPMSAVGRSPS